jgi:hypothetical protein
LSPERHLMLQLQLYHTYIAGEGFDASMASSGNPVFTEVPWRGTREV